MSNTHSLNLPYIQGAQSQKHITHNEALRVLDSLAHLNTQSLRSDPPSSNVEDGQKFLVGPQSLGDWAGHEGDIAVFLDGGWLFYPSQQGWLAYILAENALRVFDGTEWQPYPNTQHFTATYGLSSAKTTLILLEETVTLTGPTTLSSVTIPDRAIVWGVSLRVRQAITGATSFSCGITGEPGKYGSLLSITLDTTNSGVTGPTAYYVDTPIQFTASGGDFTGGEITLAIHALICVPPQ